MRTGLLIAFLVGIAGATQAAPVIFNPGTLDRTAFDAVATITDQEGFEGSFNSGTTIDFGSFAISANSAAGQLAQDSFGRFVSEGTNALDFDETTAAALTFTFDTAITAFGLDYNDLNFANVSFADDLGNAIADVLLGDNASSAGGSGFENKQFLGVANSQSFTSVTLTLGDVGSQSGGLAIDNLVFGSASLPPVVQPPAVPLPASLPLVLAGLGAFGALRLRRASSRRAS